jgi:hypothetical protein
MGGMKKRQQHDVRQVYDNAYGPEERSALWDGAIR